MAEVVTVEKYKSLNGYTYDSLKDAELADAEWRSENEFDLEKDIARLTKRGQREIAHLGQYKNRFPELYVLESKWQSLYFVANSLESVPQVFFEILKFNKDCDFYWSPAAKAITDEIIRTNNYHAAIAFIKDRVDYQYEKVSVESVSIF